jgi:hypothetical protein
MCDKCTDIDGKIAHYQKIIAGIYHRHTEQRLRALIEEMRAEKAKLHPNSQWGCAPV